MDRLALVFDLLLIGSLSVSEVEQLLDEEVGEQMVKSMTLEGREAGD